VPLTSNNVFRGFTPGDQVGPYLSQFLLRDVPYGSQMIPAQIRTLLPGIDFMTTFHEWLRVQRGCDAAQSNCDPVSRYIRSPRDLGQFVHVDATFNAFLNAAAILAGRGPARRCEAASGLGVPLAKRLPYINPMAPIEEESPGKAPNEIGMQTFGFQHITSMLLEVMNRALKAVWYQKWLVHRRLRPEAFGGRLHRHITTTAYTIDSSYSTSPIFASTGRSACSCTTKIKTRTSGEIRITTKAHTCCPWSSPRVRRFTRLMAPGMQRSQVRVPRFSKCFSRNARSY
jgi:hypothetical protein